MLAGAGGPEVGVDVGEDAVAHFDGGEAFGLFGGDGSVGFQMLVDGLELVELVHVGLEAELGVVAGGAGGDEELPVGGFEEEELAAELFDDALGDGLGGVVVGFPFAGGADVAEVELGGIDLGVGPGGFGIHPDVVGAFGAPGAFVHFDEAGAGELVEVLRAGGEMDADGVVVEGAGDGLEPLRAFEPPVTEELGVEGRGEDGGNGIVHGGVDGFPDEMDEVGGVGLGALGGAGGVVGLLVGHVDVGAGDGPVAMTAGPALLVEVEVVAVAGIAEVAGPDLGAGAGVAGEDGDGVLWASGVWSAVDVVGLVEAAIVVVGHGLVGGADDGAVAELVGGGSAGGLFDEVGVDEEEVDVGFADGLFDANAIEGGSDGRAVLLGDGIVPEAGGAIAALGRPDAARVFADVALVGGDGGADLGANALVGAEERHVAVGGAAGDDLDQAGIVEVAKAFDDVAVEGLEVGEGVGEIFLPEAGELGVVEFADGEEVGFIFAGGEDLALEIAGEVGLEDGVGKLLEEDGGEIEAAVEGDAVALKIAEDAEERKVGFGGGFVEPLNAMRPGAVIDDPGQVGMEGEGEEAGGLAGPDASGLAVRR